MERTNYFWTLNAAALAGYFALTSKTLIAQSFAPFLIACLGFAISVAWFLVNKGSKMWQENWENHVAALSVPLVGSLY